MSNIYRPKFNCECTDCKYNDGDGDCMSEWVTISNDTMTVAGFCQYAKNTRKKNMISLITVSVILSVFGWHVADISTDARVIISAMCILSDIHIIIKAID